MDFTSRNGQSAQGNRVTPQMSQPSVQPTHQSFGADPGNAKKPNNDGGKQGKRFVWNSTPSWLRIANVILLFSVTIVAVSVVFLLRNANPTETQYIGTKHYQAVFLSNGQVYFGKIAAVNSKFINLQDIFYLNSNSTATGTTAAASTTSSANNYTLVKLGCELHGPYDQMIINNDQVSFWENLQDSGQVVKTITNWNKENPHGQTCSTTSSSTGQSTTSSTAAASPQSSSAGTSSATGTTPTTTGTGTSTKQ